ncbi:MAG: MBOAT family protein [Melioribacteraceae bacterium]|nr:MBOAT family protein [Melioribacteraceae bacterium]
MFNIDFSKIGDLLLYDQYDPLLFGSSLFLFLFFGFLLFYRIFAKSKNTRILLILFFSLYFYYKASGLLLLVLVFSAVFNFFFGKWLFNTKGDSRRRMILIFNVFINLGLLAYFKYTNFFVELINDLQIGQLDPLDLLMPIGISFYTFKSMNYVLDIYLESMEPTKSFRDFCVFVFFFPNILAGPIDRASQFLPQVESDLVISREDIGKALLLIMSGLIKKIVIADYLSLNFIDRVFDEPLRFSGIENLFAMYSYGLQIYCDFSGYSDIAIGIALLMGFKLMDNFNSPYQATSIADFWRRWHISLSTWLLDYLFRPVQMKFRNLKIYGNVIALMVTFILCGFWHGASWMFIFWGFLHGVFMSVSLFLQKPKKKLYKAIKLTNTRVLKFGQVFVTFHLLIFSWLFFRVQELSTIGDIFNQIFSFFKPSVLPQFIAGYTPTFVILILGYVLHFLPESLENKTVSILSRMNPVIQGIILAAVIWLCAQVQSAELQPFIYFQF